jgi:hypothetical protein
MRERERKREKKRERRKKRNTMHRLREKVLEDKSDVLKVFAFLIWVLLSRVVEYW